MKKVTCFILSVLLSQVTVAQQRTISSLAEFVDLQSRSNQDIKMEAGTYHFSSSSKSLFAGGDWRVNELGNWPGLLQFSGNNNTYDLTGVTFTFDSTILLEMPSIAHGKLVQLGGSGNVWKGFNLQERSNGGDYGYFRHTSGGAILEITGDNHEFYDLTLNSRFSQPYGLGSIYGKTGSSSGRLPGSALNKKSGLSINVLDDTYFENTIVDHSGFGHPLVFNGPIEDLVFETVSVIAETRSTNHLIANGVGGTDRNGVPFHVNYNGDDMTGNSGKTDFLNLFNTSNLNRCQNLDSGNQNAPIQPNFQYSLVEDAFRGYTQGEIGQIEVYNATVTGARSGIALEYAAEGMIVENMTVRGIAGHGVPACGGWNGSNGGEGDATAFGPPSFSVLKNVRADAAYSTIMEVNGNSRDIEADIELLDPSNGYNRPPASTALALLGGDNHEIRIWKRDNRALTRDLVIKVGNGNTDNLLLCNMTQQDVTIDSNVTNSTIYSVGNISNSSNSSARNTVVKLSSAANEPNICKALASEPTPIPTPTPTATPTPTSGGYVSMRKSNAMSYAIDGNQGGENAQNVYLWSFKSTNKNQHWEEISRGGGYYSYKKRDTNYCLDGNHGGGNGQNVYLWECSTNNQNQHWKKINVNGQFRLEKRNSPGFSLDGNRGGADAQNLYLWQSNSANPNQLWELTSH